MRADLLPVVQSISIGTAQLGVLEYAEQMFVQMSKMPEISA